MQANLHKWFESHYNQTKAGRARPPKVYTRVESSRGARVSEVIANSFCRFVVVTLWPRSSTDQVYTHYTVYARRRPYNHSQSHIRMPSNGKKGFTVHFSVAHTATAVLSHLFDATRFRVLHSIPFLSLASRDNNFVLFLVSIWPRCGSRDVVDRRCANNEMCTTIESATYSARRWMDGPTRRLLFVSSHTRTHTHTPSHSHSR